MQGWSSCRPRSSSMGFKLQPNILPWAGADHCPLGTFFLDTRTIQTCSSLPGLSFMFSVRLPMSAYQLHVTVLKDAVLSLSLFCHLPPCLFPWPQLPDLSSKPQNPSKHSKHNLNHLLSICCVPAVGLDAVSLSMIYEQWSAQALPTQFNAFNKHTSI